MNISRVKKVLAILIFMFISVALGAYKFNCDKDAKRLYSQGMEFYKKNNYSDAYYNFKQIDRFSNMYQLSLLKQFQCANYLADKKTAKLKLKQLIKSVKNPYIKPYLLYSDAILSSDENANSDIRTNQEILEKFEQIYNNYKNNDYAIASAYRIAKLKVLNEIYFDSTKDKFIEYLSYAPQGKFALDALDELSKFNISFSDEDYEIMANAYLLNQEYSNAIKYYKKTPFSKNWTKIAKCYNGLKDYTSEQNIILNGLNLKESEVSEKEIDNAIDRLITISNAGKIQTLQNLYVKYPKSYIVPTVAYKLAESSTSIRSIKLYELVMDKYPNSIWASNSLWEVFWYNYKLERFKVCENLALIHTDLYSNTQDAPRIAYWYGKVLLKEKRNSQAKEIFYNVIENYPLSYYAFLSKKQLHFAKAGKMIIKKPIANYDIDSINKYLFKDKLLMLLAQYDDYQTIDDLKINDEYIKSWINHKKGNYPFSIKIAKDELVKNNVVDFSDPILKLAYPILYSEEINFYAKENKLSPYLFMSLVREESHFDKNAKSRVGALGLSQIMPSTANFIEKKPISESTLLDVDENIKIGLKYFSYLVDYFNDNAYLAILAYNAGPGNITKWIEDPTIESDEIDVFVENIPYLETKNYIKKILSTYWIYGYTYSPRNR